MQHIFTALCAALFFIPAAAQLNIPIDDQNFVTIADCDSVMISAGAYEGANLYHLNLVLPDTSATLVINPEYFGHVWDVDGESELRVYNGFDASAQLLESYNTSDDPNGFLLHANADSLRIELETSAGTSGAGFTMALFCNESIRALPMAKFKPVFIENWYHDEQLGMDVMHACKNDSFHIALEPVYIDPQGENQNVDSVEIKWALGDRTFKRGKGLTQIDHVYTKGVGYRVVVYSQDSTGAESYLNFTVHNSPEPAFTVDPPEAFCQNEPTEIVGGMDGNEVVGAMAQAASTVVTEFYGAELYLPDGNDENYTTSIEVSGFEESTVISNMFDLVALCVNMEHSYLGDLEMMLTCPNGTSINIFNSYGGDGLFPGGFNGGGTYLGDANDQFMSPNGVPGIGFDYCFSGEAEWGTLGQEYDLGNLDTVSTFQFGQTMPSGLYKPEDGFYELEGCPVNGQWTLTVRDNFAFDDGFIFDWSLSFSEELGSGLYQYPLVDAAWEASDWISAVNAGAVEVTPPDAGPTELTFTVTDQSGCDFSHEMLVQVSDTLNPIEEPIICDFTHEVIWPNQAGELTWVSGPSSDVTITHSGDFFEVEVPQTGEYTFAFHYFDCSATPEAQLTFLEEDDPACVTTISDVDFDKTVVLSPNPADDHVDLSFDLRRSQRVQITITTVDGRPVQHGTHNLSSGSPTLRIDIEDLASGTYVLQLKGENFQMAKVLVKG